jgi:adenine-specific DNA-methyltransferase
MQNLQTELIDLLKHEDNLVVDGHLNKNKIVELALKVEPQLISLLIKNDTFKKHFFQEVENVLVFDKIKFQRFVNNKSFLPDSYTAFKNKIGLITNDDDLDNFISTSNDVVLAWPHKDCVLEGGQTKEDQKRNEVFWNETLAPDSVDRLLDAKALTNFKKFDKDGEHKVTNLKGDENLIIKGNNLLALASLLKTHSGKIKLIYIDPPYNTGSDGFNYNDSFNHSSWLTFMKNRLNIAKKLLKPDGVIFVSLDDKEAHYCKVLMDDIFGRENFIADICHKSRGSISNDKIISPNHNHILLFAKNERLVFANKAQFGVKKSFESFKLKDELGEYKLVPVDGPGGASKGNPHYEFEGVTGYWRFSKERMQRMFDEGLVIRTNKGLQQKYYKEKAALSKQTVSTWWDDNFLTSSATSELKKMMGDDVFSNPKNTNLLKRIVDLWTNNDDIILDYHAGSGTTAHAVLEMNNEDGGNRRFIMCEQMDYINTVTNKRIQKVIELNQKGSFVYTELMQYNQKYIDLIQNAANKDQLISVWNEMKDTAFLSYQFDKKTFNERLEAFKTAPIEEMKQYLVEVLDKNQLYVNYSEINDETFKVSKEDKELNKQFYSKK